MDPSAWISRLAGLHALLVLAEFISRDSMEPIIWHLLGKSFWFLLQNNSVCFQVRCFLLDRMLRPVSEIKKRSRGDTWKVHPTTGEGPQKAQTLSAQPSMFFPHCQRQLRVRCTGLGRETCHTRHICNYPHPLKDGLDSTLAGVYTKWQEWALAVHTCRRIFSARGSVLHMEADKGCLVPSHHCEHARTRKAERRQSNAAIAWLLWWWWWVLKKSGWGVAEKEPHWASC